MIVVDASVAIAWSLKEAGSVYAEAVLERVIVEGAVVPAHWPLEVANGLLAAERSGRIAADQVDVIGMSLGDLAIDIRPVELSTAFWGILEAARDHKLTEYDAAYLHLCVAGGFELATLDAPLRAACQKAGISLAS